MQYPMAKDRVTIVGRSRCQHATRVYKEGVFMPSPEELRRLSGPEPSWRERRQQKKQEAREDRQIYQEYLAREAAKRKTEEQQRWQDAKAIADAANATLVEAARRREHSANIEVDSPDQAGKVAGILSSQGHNVTTESLTREESDGGDGGIYDITHYSVKVKW
jgi:flagellar biosynthesis GTPase FlhF